MQQGLHARKEQSQRRTIDLRHNRIGNIGPFQHKKLRQRSRMLLGGAVVFFLIAASGLGIGLFFPDALGPGGGGLPHQNHTPAYEAVVFGCIAAILFVFSAGAWWQLEADIDNSVVQIVEGKAMVRDRIEDANSKSPRYCTIGFARFSMAMLDNAPRINGRYIRAYYTPGTRLLLAIEPIDSV